MSDDPRILDLDKLISIGIEINKKAPTDGPDKGKILHEALFYTWLTQIKQFLRDYIDEENEFRKTFFDCVAQEKDENVIYPHKYHVALGLRLLRALKEYLIAHPEYSKFNKYAPEKSKTSDLQVFPSQSSPIVESDSIKILLGHGNDPQWRLLKDHLKDLHHLDVVAYEMGPRAGFTVKDVLEEMLDKSAIGFIVLTGEDIKNFGEIHARENTIHELGLCQGRFGFNRGIALVEEGVTEFSNIHGINQIRFSKGNIRETFGDVIATIKREFPGNYS
jgi:hypothetical protein